MAKYRVSAKETSYSSLVVNAHNETEAKEKAIIAIDNGETFLNKKIIKLEKIERED